MNTKSIRQSVLFRAAPREVYEALMDSKKHTRFSGETARISRKIGGKFKAYGDYIEGVNLELVANKKIVQSWRGSDWEPGHFSTVTFALSKVQSGTKLSFAQVGVPERFHKDIRQGWKDYYWKPMKAMLEKA
jgi:activator of HSP90 ATPase